MQWATRRCLTKAATAGETGGRESAGGVKVSVGYVVLEVSVGLALWSGQGQELKTQFGGVIRI